MPRCHRHAQRRRSPAAWRRSAAPRNAPQKTMPGGPRSCCFRPAPSARSRSCAEPAQIEDCVWRWQERFAEPLGQEVIDQVVALTATELPDEATHCTGPAMAKAAGQHLLGVAHVEGARRVRAQAQGHRRPTLELYAVLTKGAETVIGRPLRISRPGAVTISGR